MPEAGAFFGERAGWRREEHGLFPRLDTGRLVFERLIKEEDKSDVGMGSSYSEPYCRMRGNQLLIFKLRKIAEVR